MNNTADDYRRLEREEASYIDEKTTLPPHLLHLVPRTSSRSRKKHTRQEGQLCKQVERILLDFLAIEVDDPDLQELWIERVEPAPDLRRLRVFFAFPHWVKNPDLRGIKQELEMLKRDMRYEVGANINRRRVPELVFELLLPGESRA